MTVETANYITELDPTKPAGASDVVAEGDDQFRMMKTVLQNSFPSVNGAVSASAAELSTLVGAASTGTTSLKVSTRTAGDSTTYPASTAFVSSAIAAAAAISLPSVASNAGMVLTTDGASASWAPTSAVGALTLMQMGYF